MDNNNLNNSIEKEENFDTTGLLLAFLANWKWFALSVVICLILAAYKIVTTVPVYNMESSIYLNDNNTNSRNAFNLSEAANPMVAFKNFIDETELEVLKSRNNLVKIVDSLGLTYSYAQKGFFRNKPLYKKNPISAKLDSASLVELKLPIFIEVSANKNDKYDVEVKTKFEVEADILKEEKEFKDITLPYTFELTNGTVTLYKAPTDTLKGTEKITIVSPMMAAKELSEAFNIEFAKKSEKIIRVSLLTNSQKEGSDIIETLVDFYNKDIIEEKNRSAVQTEAFILDRLVMISNELSDVENRLKDYRQTHNVTNIQEQSRLNLSLRSDYEQKKSEVETQLRILEEIEKLVSNSNTIQTLPAIVNDNTTMAQIIEEYNKKVNQFNRALEGSTPDNPLVRSLQDELNRDKVRILQNITTSKASLATERNSRRAEIALQKTLATNTARLIDDPTGEYPVAPKKLLLLAAAFLFGLAVPAGIIFLRRMFFPVFGDKEDLKRITNVPIIGEICTSEDKEHKDIVVGKNISSSIAELFRLLRNNISFTRVGADSRVILVTSSISGEGKTFVTSNLALTYALMGKKVVVVGLDLRNPMLAHSFGLSNREGVTTYLTGQTNDLNSLLKQVDRSSNLHILPAGPVPPNPNELLMSDRMGHMIEALSQEFDYVFLDTAPIGLVSDTFLITRYSDIQLYVARANYTSNKCLKELQSAIETGKLPAAYIVLNGVNMTASSYTYRRYGDYHRKNAPYGYGYDRKKDDE